MKSRLLLLASFLLLGASVQADIQGQMIRTLAGKYKPSLVTLSLIVKLSSGGYEDQTEMEAEGVLMDSSGLVVTTNSAVDPLSAFSDEDGPGGAASMSSRVTSVKILTASGAEIPAKVVLRDKDLNLAFVRPLKRPNVKLQGINFQYSGTAQIGDPVYLLGRQGKTGNRSMEAKSERVVSVMDRPRRFYVLDPYNQIYLGNVVFNEKGQPLGFLTLRVPAGKARMREHSLPVIIPGQDVVEVARQAPQAKDVKEAAPVQKPAAKATKPAAVPSR